MKLLRLITLAALLVGWPHGVAVAQTGVVFLPPVTPGDCVTWFAPNIIKDAGYTCDNVAPAPAGSTTQLQYNNAGVFGGITGATSNGTIVTLVSPVVTTAFTATGLVTNADLVNALTTVNGQACTLGSSCTVTAVASSLTVGATTVTGGTTGRVLYDNSGTLGEMTTTGSGTVLALATSPVFTTPNLGTPSAVTLTFGTGLPVSTGITGLGTGIATFLATPSSANLAAALTNETGTGAAVFATSPTLVTPILGAATATTLTLSGLPTSDPNSAGVLWQDNNLVMISTAGAAPTCGSGCASIAGTSDNAFVATTGTAQTSVVVNFGHTWPAVPVCLVSSNSLAAIVDVSSTTTTAVTFGASVALTGANLNVICQ